MTPLDLEVSKGLVKVLKSGKNSKFNALFLNPFNLNDTPGYLDICGRVMDLSTLSLNIDSGRYSNRKQVYDDCNLIFENAIKYHSDKDATKWIVSPAQHMLKIAKREQDKIEAKIAKGMTAGSSSLPKLKLKLGGDKAKTKIKIKQPAARATGATIARGKTPPAGAGVVSRGKAPPAGVGVNAASGSPGSTSKPPPNKKPRLTLKLGLGKSNTPTGSSAKSKTTTKSSATTTKKTSPQKKSIKSPVGGGGSRGKELPKGVANQSAGKVLPKGVVVDTKITTKTTKATKAKATTKSTTPKSATLKSITPKASTAKTKATTKTKKSSTKTKISLKTTSAYKATAGALPMTPARKAQCWKILNGLKRRKAKNIIWFEKPVSDKKLIQDYKAKIKYPMDLSTMQTKLDNTTFGAGGSVSSSGGSKGGYTSVAAFVWDLRRIFGNCLRYNTTNGKGSLRPIAIETLEVTDQLCTFFLAKHEHQQSTLNNTPLYPPLLFCWKLCLGVIDTLYNLTNEDDGNPTAYYFMHPVSFFFGGTLPADYLHKAPKPMDFGTVTSQLMEGQYATLEQFETDCRLVISNCMAYYGGKPESAMFCKQATRLNQVLDQQLGGLNRYVKSNAGLTAQKSATLGISTATLLPKPPIPLLLNILAELRDQKYTDKATKITEPAMAKFEKPVSVAVYDDYMQYVQTPMDLQTVERKIKNVKYSTPEDFEFDMILMFQNCIMYNGSSGKKIDHLVALGKFGLKAFRKIFTTRMKVRDDQQGSFSSSATTRKDPPAGDIGQGSSKRIKLDASRAKNAPRISLSAATLSEAAAAQRKKAEAKANQPVPLHIAIARVKERFPLRRDVKSLQHWEAACARFFKELKRHPWISAARPKFIFHVPVPVLFPAIREAYSTKIEKPMDLTTAECTLLAGNKYTVAEDFVNDVALVFANSIRFNKDARDVGDPLSCAYYDASIHLLKYTRWLSLELLQEYFIDIEDVDEPDEEGMPLSSWRLNKGNLQKAREEMEKLVLNEIIEKSLEGDRYTWMESECEKLLKSLRHQSDLKYMTYFLTPNYPPDYSAFISRPMDWEKVQKTLKKRNYDTFGAVIEDLRLIFSNALKYNGKHKGTQSVSGRAYDAAEIMSAKLEVAIKKIMVTVSDRVERERIDHSNARREIEAAERVEAERIRSQWGSDGKNQEGKTEGGPQRVEGSLRVRNSSRRSIRQSDTDFEVPFFEEDFTDGQHEESYVEVMKQQKATFERQREELVAMRKSTKGIGLAIFKHRNMSSLASKWIEDEQKRLGISPPAAAKSTAPSLSSSASTKSSALPSPSEVSSKLEEKDRAPVKMKLVGKMKGIKGSKKKKKASKRKAMDWGDDED
eukprot:CAMPEP_0116119480 /NCGR_PEP_ID=MMETSP0329-20121206/2662_1 /TAXON_ID=697910 /ORGANISM="Pseudo-nitzschia arenysensis, Strain B593" /LENGTH=1354 /DNA_ID=CAMNT_0003613181 /DNA_START=473 /DNA_END=4537 /DNA_ORIENTATION=-